MLIHELIYKTKLNKRIVETEGCSPKMRISWRVTLVKDLIIVVLYPLKS